MRVFVSTVILLYASAMAQQPPVRVRLLTLYHLKQITLTPRAESFVQQMGNRRTLHGALTISADGDLVDSQGSRSSKLLVTGEVEINAAQVPAAAVHVPIEITASDGELQVIGIYPVEEYVAEVLQGETAGQMPPEALKALAVAIRSYATKFRERHKAEGFDFCGTTHCQFLRTDVAPNVRAAAKATESELLWDRGSPLASYYHKDCGGRTEDAAAVWPDQRSPALTSHEDPYCTRSAKPWRSEIARADIAHALDAAGLQAPAKWDRIVVGERTASGRAKLLEISAGASQQRVMLSASSFRFALGRALGWNTLKSDWYEINSSGDHFIFSGRGTGHGVGLCQDGASEMAREGKPYRDILAFYYPGAVIGRSAQGIPWTTMHEQDFDIRSLNGADSAAVADEARDAFSWAQKQTDLKAKVRPILEVYPTVAMFRDATGEPGWVAANTHDERIRLEPPTVLKSSLQNVLRHEFLHLLIEGNAKVNTPLWFREGLVLEISGERGKRSAVTTAEMEKAITSRGSQAAMKEAYAAAAAEVFELEQRVGRPQLLRWLRDGLPSDLLAVDPHKVPK